MADPDTTLLACDSLTVGVPGRVLVGELDLALTRGEFVAILGRNGSGKTLTLMTLAGLRAPGAGRVSLDGEPLESQRRQRIARRLALLPQDTEDIFPATVLDSALVGRHPHIGRLSWESAEDHAITRAALAKAGIAELAGRDVLTLSGGERRRLAIAQVLAQAPDVYLLDEPTNHLDPHHQQDCLQVFRRATADGSAVIASLHDANLAVRFADRCLLLFGDGRWELGPTDTILTASRLEALYGTPVEAVPWRDSHVFVAAPRPWMPN